MDSAPASDFRLRPQALYDLSLRLQPPTSASDFRLQPQASTSGFLLNWAPGAGFSFKFRAPSSRSNFRPQHRTNIRIHCRFAIIRLGIPFTTSLQLRTFRLQEDSAIEFSLQQPALWRTQARALQSRLFSGISPTGVQNTPFLHPGHCFFHHRGANTPSFAPRVYYVPIANNSFSTDNSNFRIRLICFVEAL